MRFYLQFLSDEYGTKEINEPIGFDAIEFNVRQEQGRMSRDVALNGDKIDFSFSPHRNHEFKQLLYYFNKFGFEAKVNLLIEIDDLNKYTCELDFATAETDDFEKFKCKGLPLSNYQILKRRRSVKVDLLSSKNVDGDFIQPLQPQNILMRATPLVQKSKWEQTVDFSQNLQSKSSDSTTGDANTNYFFVNPAQNLLESGIENSSTFFETFTKYKDSDNMPTTSDFFIIQAKNNLTNLKINVKNLDLTMVTDVDNGGNGYVDMKFKAYYGTDLVTAKQIDLLSVFLTENQTYTTNQNFSFVIPEVKRDDKVWLFLSFKVRQSANVTVLDARFECQTDIKGMTFEAEAESASYNSICPSFSLYEAMKQVVKSISGMDIVATRFQDGGQFYGNRLLNGNFLRGIKDKPFNVSLEDIEKSLAEIKCDYEITPDGKVFFGSESDFYTNTEMAVYPNIQFSDMTKTFNPLYMINEFYFSYKNYQALKENTIAGTADTIHGESRFVLNNKKVENKKVVEVDWIRDTLLIETQRNQALLIKDNTSTQDDDGLFIIDTISTTSDQQFTEVTELSHFYDTSNGRLTLRTDGGINFLLLGITIGTPFEILTPDLNTGTYTVYFIDSSQIILTKTSIAPIGSSGDGIRSTRYKYTIDDLTIPFTNRTNQGFDSIFNLGAGDKYSNLRYSTMRNIRNYWNSYLASANLYWKNITIKNNWYKNNGDCVTSYEGDLIKEKQDFTPTNPIVTPMLYSSMIFKSVDFLDFVNLQNNIRTQRGYIRAIDNNNKVIKIYPTEIEYSYIDKELNVKGEEKYEPRTMTIATMQGYLLINNETRVDEIIFEIKNEKLFIFDTNRQLLYNGVYWYEVSINGALANDKKTLLEWLNLL